MQAVSSWNVSYSSSVSSNSTNVYVNPDLEIINPTNNVLDLGIFMSGDCSFEFHIRKLCKNCTNLADFSLSTKDGVEQSGPWYPGRRPIRYEYL